MPQKSSGYSIIKNVPKPINIIPIIILKALSIFSFFNALEIALPKAA